MKTVAAGMPDLTESDISAALNFVDSSDRDTWVKMAMAVKSELGDAGFDIWDQWSRQSANYSERDARHVWKSCKAHGSVTIATLIFEAQQAGFSFDTTVKLTDEQAAQRQAARQAAQKQSAAEERERQKQASETATNCWNMAVPCDLHPYLSRKHVKAHGLRVGNWPLRNKFGEIYGQAENVLLIPIMDERGTIISLQGIFDQLPYGYEKNKSFWRDGRKSGGFFMIGKVGESDTIALTEGYATGATIHELTGWTVAVCFDRTNLESIAQTLKAMRKGCQVVICADNDQFTEGNPGVKDARAAAALIGARVAIPHFASLEGKPTDFNDLFVREGAGVVIDQLGFDPDIDSDNDNEPFCPLGYNRGDYFYLVYGTKQITKITASQHSKSNLLQLAPLSFWCSEFPGTGQSMVSWDMAADFLMRNCERKGVFSPDIIRGRGAWLDDGRTVYHFGSHLWVDGVAMATTAIRSRYVYEMDRRINEPAASALTDEEGQKLVDIATKFRWTKPASAALLSGFVGLAPICGALRWRPHIWITGGAGCGKTTVLNEYVHTLMAGTDIFAQGNSTEAGIRQELRSDALPVLFDESEQNNERETSRVQNIIALIRQASSQSGAKTLKGTASGEAMQFHIRSMFCLSSIQVGIKHQADVERLTVLALRPKREEREAADNWKQLKEQLYWMQRDQTLPARLFRRSLEILPTTLMNIEIFVDAAAKHFGSVREGDQYGTLLAGCWSLTCQRVATPAEAAAMIAQYDWSEYRESQDTDESVKALIALMESQIKTSAGGSASVYEVVRAARGDDVPTVTGTASDADQVLQRYGMRVIGNDLVLSNTSHALSELMKNTPYASDIRGQLLRVKGVRRYEKSVRIGSAVTKCIAISASVIMDPIQEQVPF